MSIVKKAKLTQYENGKIVVEPYAHTENQRYSTILDLEYGKLMTTKESYRLLLLFPKKDGVMAAARNLLNEATRVSKFFANLFMNGGAK